MNLPRTVGIGLLLFFAALSSGAAFSQPLQKLDTLECTVRSRADYYENGLPKTSVFGASYLGDSFVLHLSIGQMTWHEMQSSTRFNTVQKIEDERGRAFLGIDIADSIRTITVLQVLDPWGTVYPFTLVEGTDFMTGDCKAVTWSEQPG